MSQDTIPQTPTQPPTQTASGATGTERAIALATSAAPVITGLIAPFLDGGTELTAGLAYAAGAGFMMANYMGRIPDTLMGNLPAGDIIQAHRSPMLISTVTAGMSLGMGIAIGPDGADALMAGFLAFPSIPGIVSLGWWAAVALTPWKLRKVLRRTPAKTAVAQAAPTGNTPHPIRTPADQIVALWGRHISDPESGAHRGQILTLRTLGTARWTGTITAPIGTSVSVTPDTVSSVYRVPTEWITLTPGAHAGESHIRVNLTPPPELDPTTLTGAWKKWVARKGGLMTDTHLVDVQPDPNTGGEVAKVVAGEGLDRLTHPDRRNLAGALRTTPLLVSYEPLQDPRTAIIRKMAHNPLQKGAAFPGVHVLKPNPNGYIQIGPGVSGFPARIQLHDPNLGAQHVLVAGVTGSGKGGTLQLIALAHHVNGSAIIYADPKGSSNPTIEHMAAYSGLGIEGAMGALRIWYHGLMHRVEQSRELGMKNFKASPDMPWAPLILDEASQLLGENAEARKEAKFIIKAGASLGRSLGMPVILANQILQLDQLGGEAAIRDNIFYGGSLVLLRSDSQQKTLIDLPDNFAGCNPADIPPAWSGDRSMVFDPGAPLDDPERTFGLAFAASPGANAEMMRMWILEDATPHINQDNITIPADWDFWDDRHDLATQSVLPGDDENGDGDDGDGTFFTSPAAPKKPASASDKILRALQDIADPLGIETVYQHKDQIAAMARLDAGSPTLNNALTGLTKAGKIHRQITDGKATRGMYGLGPAPEDSNPATEYDEA